LCSHVASSCSAPGRASGTVRSAFAESDDMSADPALESADQLLAMRARAADAGADHGRQRSSAGLRDQSSSRADAPQRVAGLLVTVSDRARPLFHGSATLSQLQSREVAQDSTAETMAAAGSSVRPASTTRLGAYGAWVLQRATAC